MLFVIVKIARSDAIRQFTFTLFRIGITILMRVSGKMPGEKSHFSYTRIVKAYRGPVILGGA